LKPVRVSAEFEQGQYTGDPSQIPVFSQPPEEVDAQPQSNEYFQQHNELKVIQEYNTEELLPKNIKNKYWGLLSKSIKLGFWDKGDESNLFFYKNIIRVGNMMAKPKHKYTFEERQEMNMLDLLVYADFKRGVGMERYRINERTLQATSVTQSIQGGGSGRTGRKGGFMAGLKSFFS